MKDQKERKGGKKGRKGREGPSMGGGSFMEKIHNRRSVYRVSRKDDEWSRGKGGRESGPLCQGLLRHTSAPWLCLQGQ